MFPYECARLDCCEIGVQPASSHRALALLCCMCPMSSQDMGQLSVSNVPYQYVLSLISLDFGQFQFLLIFVNTVLTIQDSFTHINLFGILSTSYFLKKK